MRGMIAKGWSYKSVFCAYAGPGDSNILADGNGH